jgi:hypothetical protein
VDYESDILRFMMEETVPFTNTQVKNSLWMTKVQQQILSYVRSVEGAKTFLPSSQLLVSLPKKRSTASKVLSYLFDGIGSELMG